MQMNMATVPMPGDVMELCGLRTKSLWNGKPVAEYGFDEVSNRYIVEVHEVLGWDAEQRFKVKASNLRSNANLSQTRVAQVLISTFAFPPDYVQRGFQVFEAMNGRNYNISILFVIIDTLQKMDNYKETVVSLNRKALYYYHGKDYDQSLVALQQALEIGRRTNDKRIALTKLYLASVYAGMKRFDEALNHCKEFSMRLG